MEGALVRRCRGRVNMLAHVRLDDLVVVVSHAVFVRGPHLHCQPAAELDLGWGQSRDSLKQTAARCCTAMKEGKQAHVLEACHACGLAAASDCAGMRNPTAAERARYLQQPHALVTAPRDSVVAASHLA